MNKQETEIYLELKKSKGSKFTDNFCKEIFPIMSSIEEQRVGLLSKLLKQIFFGSILIISAIFVFGMLIVYFNHNIATFIIGFIGLFVVGTIGERMMVPLAKYRKSSKNQYINSIVKFLDSDLTYNITPHLYDTTMNLSKIFFPCSLEKFENHIKSLHNNMSFDIIEADCKRNYGKFRTKIFKGTIIRIKMDIRFNGITIISKKPNKYNKWVKKIGWEPLKVGVVENNYEIYSFNQEKAAEYFEEKYPEMPEAMKAVYKNNQNEISSFSDASFRKLLEPLKEIYNSNHIECLAIEQELILFISSKQNKFATPTILSTIYNENKLLDFLQNMQKIVEVKRSIIEIANYISGKFKDQVIQQEEADKLSKDRALSMIDSINQSYLEKKLSYDEGLKKHCEDLLKNNPETTSLKLGGDKFGNDEINLLFTALIHNNTLVELAINNCRMRGAAAASIMASIANKKNLTKLDFSNNSIKRLNAEVFADQVRVNQSLKHLNLSNNKITDEFAIELADALRVNNTINAINLSGNRIGDEGAVALADALKINKSLTILDIQNNWRITDRGFAALDYAMKARNDLQIFYRDNT